MSGYEVDEQMELTKLQKEYVEMHGWVRKKGILINTHEIDDAFEEYFVPDDNSEDIYEKATMWVDKNGDDEDVYSDDEIIEAIEDCSEISYKKFVESKKNRGR